MTSIFGEQTSLYYCFRQVFYRENKYCRSPLQLDYASLDLGGDSMFATVNTANEREL